jgi:hypothetical protein
LEAKDPKGFPHKSTLNLAKIPGKKPSLQAREPLGSSEFRCKRDGRHADTKSEAVVMEIRIAEVATRAAHVPIIIKERITAQNTRARGLLILAPIIGLVKITFP